MTTSNQLLWSITGRPDGISLIGRHTAVQVSRYGTVLRECARTHAHHDQSMPCHDGAWRRHGHESTRIGDVGGRRRRQGANLENPSTVSDAPWRSADSHCGAVDCAGDGGDSVRGGPKPYPHHPRRVDPLPGNRAPTFFGHILMIFVRTCPRRHVARATSHAVP